MKAVLISIQPKYCKLIVDGEKTIEVRKSYPKQLKTPFKCYIYCTKSAGNMLESGKVCAEFICDKVEPFTVGSLGCDDIEKSACLSYEEMINYFYKPRTPDGITVKTGYGWHISDLKIYDKPKELGEFWKLCKYSNDCPFDCEYWTYSEKGRKHFECGNVLTSPPQSWSYVEVDE